MNFKPHILRRAKNRRQETGRRVADRIRRYVKRLFMLLVAGTISIISSGIADTVHDAAWAAERAWWARYAVGVEQECK